MDLIDIAVNLASRQFEGRVASIVNAAEHHGVAQLLAVGTSLEASETCSEFATQWPGRVRATAGLHPHYASAWTPELADKLDALMVNAAAVGECGLDYFRLLAPEQDQLRAFRGQMELAAKHNLPLYLHCRDAFDPFVQELKAHGTGKGVVHCFTGTVAEATRLLDLGYDLGVTGWLCDERRVGELADVVRWIPLTRLHLETDSPYLYPALSTEKRGKRVTNEPKYLVRVAQRVAELKSISVGEVATQCTENSRALFGFAAPRSRP